jgi:hypothetical protein
MAGSESPRKTVIQNAFLVSGSGAPVRDTDNAYIDGTTTEIDQPAKASTAHATIRFSSNTTLSLAMQAIAALSSSEVELTG